MGKIPYMPFYIGDWEQDLNACSLQTEAAWLKIVIKMFKDDKCGIYKTSIHRLQILWKCSGEVVEEILSDLREENIGEIKSDGNHVIFKNRRMLKEKELSKIRSKSVQTRYKTSTKRIQNTESENESENDTTIEKRKEKFFKDAYVTNIVKATKAHKKGAPTITEVILSKASLREFCDYWTEHGPNDKKMRYEKQASFDTNLRMHRWKNNQFDKSTTAKTNEPDGSEKHESSL